MVNSFKQSMSREIVLEEMNCEENTESVSDDYNVVDYEEVDSNSLADTEKIDETIPYNDDDDNLSYLPCAAHNIQLVIKDCLKLEVFKELIKKTSSIGSKCRRSIPVAEELRKLNKKLIPISFERSPFD